MKSVQILQKLMSLRPSNDACAYAVSSIQPICTACRRYLYLSISVICIGLTLSCSEDTVRPRSKSDAQSSWQRFHSGTTVNLRDVYCVDGVNAIAVGDEGTILHYDGADWSAMESGTTNDLFAVWGCGMENVYAAGDSGTMLLFDGMTWSAMDCGTTEPIRALWSSDGSQSCHAGWVAVYALTGGTPGSLLLYDYWTGPVPVWQSFPSGSSEELVNIMGFQNNYAPYFELCAVGRNGAVHFFNWTDWHQSDTGITDDLFAVAGEAPDHLFVVADNGNVYQNTKRWLEDPPSGSWRRVAGLGGGRLLDIAIRSYNDIYMVGENGRIVHYNRRQWSEINTNTSSTIRAVWAGESNVIAVGDGGLILWYSDPPSPPTCPINVTLTVTDDIMPYITWTPDCPVSKIIVEDEMGGAWWFIAADGNLIESGVQYGSVPPGALEYCPTGALKAGEVFRVSLIRRDWHNEVLVGAWNVIPSDSQATGILSASRATARDSEDWLAKASAEPGGMYSKFFLPGLRQTIPGQEIYACGEVLLVHTGPWCGIGDPALRGVELNVHPVIVERLIIDPQTGYQKVITIDYYRLGDLSPSPGYTVIWDILKQ